MAEELFPVVFPDVRDYFSIAVGAEAVAASFQPGALLGVIEQLAVENDLDTAILVGYRLPAVIQADDAEPARRQPEARLFQEPVFVRPAMNQRRRHRLKRAERRERSVGQMNHPCDAAHRVFLRATGDTLAANNQRCLVPDHPPDKSYAGRAAN
jgi:hypothetical protein